MFKNREIFLGQSGFSAVLKKSRDWATRGLRPHLGRFQRPPYVGAVCPVLYLPLPACRPSCLAPSCLQPLVTWSDSCEDVLLELCCVGSLSACS